MVASEEQYRLLHYQAGERPPGMYATIHFLGKNPPEIVERLRSVMFTIAEYGGDDWPSDERWNAFVPDWLTSTFRTYSKDEILQIRSDRSTWASLAWMFGSWLDRMRDRDWEWWSVSVTADSVTVHVAVDGYPFSTGALEHLIVAAGGYGLSVDEQAPR